MSVAPCLSGKQRYASDGDARAAVRAIKTAKPRLRTRDDLEAFWCTGCGGWHLGNRRPSDRRLQRRGTR